MKKMNVVKNLIVWAFMLCVGYFFGFDTHPYEQCVRMDYAGDDIFECMYLLEDE